MKLNIKSLILTGLLVASSFVASASTISLTLTNGAMTNVVPNFGSAKITQIIASTVGTNVATYSIIDTPTNWLSFTNAAYTNILSYATNYVTTWTNYYGVTNSITNISLFDATNAVAATNYPFPVRISVAVPSNSVVRADNVNYYFTSSPWVTNSGTGNIILTITYQQ